MNPDQPDRQRELVQQSLLASDNRTERHAVYLARARCPHCGRRMVRSRGELLCGNAQCVGETNGELA